MRLVTFAQRSEASPRVGELLADGTIVELEASHMLQWLAGAGHDASGRQYGAGEVRLMAPVPNPPSVRDFYAYEGHVASGFRSRGAEIPDEWYERPAFYFSNPAAIYGPDEPINRPSGTEMLDFELEIGAGIDGAGALAGCALMNDGCAL